MHHTTLTIPTPGRGFVDITSNVRDAVAALGARSGLCHLFVRHTSASLLIQENADPSVLRDLEVWMSALVRDGDPRFTHTEEGPDDMSAHVRGALTATQLSVPILDGELALGVWQGLYLWEHRTRGRAREVVCSVLT